MFIPRIIVNSIQPTKSAKQEIKIIKKWVSKVET